MLLPRYCLFRLAAIVCLDWPASLLACVRLSSSFCKDELAPQLNTDTLTRQLSDGVIRCLLYPAGILVINLYAKKLFDMEVCLCRRTVMKLYMILNETSNAKGFSKVNCLSLKHICIRLVQQQMYM